MRIIALKGSGWLKRSPCGRRWRWRPCPGRA